MTPEEKTALVKDLAPKYRSLFESSPDCDHDTFVLFRTANRVEYNTYRTQRDAEATRSDADFNLSFACVVWPARTELEALLDRYPAFASSLAVDIIHQSGGLKSTVKKV